MALTHPRLKRELKTIGAMIRIYCRSKHHTKRSLCDECDELFSYARARLDKCPFQEGKTTCVQCPVHCYKPGRREEVRRVMRFAGPRMLYVHPIMTLFHYCDSLRKEPLKKRLEA